MVDKAYKIGQWLWLIKERVVLLIMLCVLCYRLFGIMNPPKQTEASNYDDKRPVPALSFEQDPPTPPMMMVEPFPNGYADLKANGNPFRYRSGPLAQTDTE